MFVVFWGGFERRYRCRGGFIVYDERKGSERGQMGRVTRVEHKPFKYYPRTER